MNQIDPKQLIQSGVHFGCRVSRWNPKMAPYIHGRRSAIHVIDIRQTVRGLLRARNFLQRLASEGNQILFVGTKRQIKGVVLEAGERTGMPVVVERWIGGSLTNYSVIRSRLKRLEELEKREETGQLATLSKKEQASLRREKRKITRNLGGIREMGGMPGAMVVVDPGREYNAVREARKMGVPVIGLLDTDCDPDSVDIVIPGNDDSLKSVRLLIEYLIEAVEEGAASARDRNLATESAERREGGVSDDVRPTRGNKLPGQGESLPEAAPAAKAGAEEVPVAAAADEATEEAPAPTAPAAEAPASTDAPAS
ncbi:MAG: 30S ribosomal protein S2 [Planctomycetota bacterium]|nr:30S ribosomal protein S2 [Planctomycetota bacterium]MDG2144256.1 30S ribosomal protein S2 [Planctomycetota bacterium]